MHRDAPISRELPPGKPDEAVHELFEFDFDEFALLEQEGYPLSWAGRTCLMFVAAAFVLLFAIAASISPDPRGFGTHQKLGLPPCSFQVWFGIPCPSCGGTTAFAHFVRGQWLRSFTSNSGATLLALFGAICLPWTAYSLWRGVAWRVHDPSRTFTHVALTLAGVTVLDWLARLILRG